MRAWIRIIFLTCVMFLRRSYAKKNRLEFAKEDFARACLLEESRQKVNGESWERFSGRKDLSLRDLTHSGTFM